MGGYNFEIVGVLEKRKAGFFGENEEDNAVLIPFRTAQKVAPAKGYLLLVIKARSGQTDRSAATVRRNSAPAAECEVRRSEQLRHQDCRQVYRTV